MVMRWVIFMVGSAVFLGMGFTCDSVGLKVVSIFGVGLLGSGIFADFFCGLTRVGRPSPL